MGAGLYNISIDEDVFDIIHFNLVSPRDKTQIFKIIKKEIVVQKLKAKMRKDQERVVIAAALEKGFK